MLVRVIAALSGALLYAGLAIWGGDGIREFFREPARAAMIVILFAASIAALFTKGNLSTGVKEDRRNRWVLGAFGILGLLSGYLPAYSDRMNWWTIDGDTVRWVGVILLAIGCCLRLWPVFVLGRRFSGLVAIQPGHALVTNGIYRVVRNPSYVGLLISALGWGLGFRSWAGVVLAALMIVPVVGRIRAEERLLRAEFGQAFEAYRGRTWRLIPGVY
jgi:protein-S-isoprenylcysteine O-methyltransferase Ste14